MHNVRNVRNVRNISALIAFRFSIIDQSFRKHKPSREH